jgi:hypothetical protein
MPKISSVTNVLLLSGPVGLKQACGVYSLNKEFVNHP